VKLYWWKLFNSGRGKGANQAVGCCKGWWQSCFLGTVVRLFGERAVKGMRIMD
jgi:hypothetical protein